MEIKKVKGFKEFQEAVLSFDRIFWDDYQPSLRASSKAKEDYERAEKRFFKAQGKLEQTRNTFTKNLERSIKEGICLNRKR